MKMSRQLLAVLALGLALAGCADSATVMSPRHIAVRQAPFYPLPPGFE